MTENAPTPWIPKAADRTGWLSGVWDHEPDFEAWADKDTGLRCAAMRHWKFGHWCGYVAVAPGHPLYGRDYMNLEGVAGLEKVTYSSRPDGSDLFWFGFNFARKSDFMPGYLREDRRDATYRTLPEAKAACVDLALALTRAQD